MRILEVSTVAFADPLYYRSNELVLSRTLVKFGHEVTIFSSDRYPKWQMLHERRAQRRAEVIDGVTIRRFCSGPEIGTVPLTPSMFKEIFNFEWDIIHAHCVVAPAAFYSALAARMKSRPFVVTEQDYDFAGLHGPRLFVYLMNTYVLGRFVTHSARAVIAFSSGATLQAQRFGAAASKIRLIPASVDSNLFRPDRRNLLKEKWGIERPIVLFVGRLAKDKSIDTLFHAFSKVTSIVPEAKLVVIGRGPDEPYLRALQRDLKLENSIFLLGRVGPGQMQYIYPGADLLVLPSAYEPFGNVVLEAMSSGLPVIGTSVGGMADTISHGKTGFHMRPRDSVQLASYLLRLLTDMPLRSRMSKAARRTAVEKFDDQVVTRSVERLYYQCLSE